MILVTQQNIFKSFSRNFNDKIQNDWNETKQFYWADQKICDWRISGNVIFRAFNRFPSSSKCFTTNICLWLLKTGREITEISSKTEKNINSE